MQHASGLPAMQDTGYEEWRDEPQAKKVDLSDIPDLLLYILALDDLHGWGLQEISGKSCD